MSTEPAEILTTRVDLPGLMRVLGRNLYSTPSVALRELVQNAHDSIARRRLEASGDFEAAITVTPDPEAGTLTIEDTGAGLTRDEIVRYLATVGAGYTGKLREAGRGAGLIGQFGLGFLSAFFVSTRVEVFTTSYQAPGVGWCFASSGGERYTIASVAPRSVGSRVVLHLSPDFLALAHPSVCEGLLRRYCCLLFEPVVLGTDGEVINRPPPPWRVDEVMPEVRRTRLALDFARRFEPMFEPLCTLPVEPGEGGGARGLLWIQDGFTYGSTDNRNVSVFVRGMLVSDDARELLPPWAGFVGGVVESDDLVPTASREDLQHDAQHAAVAAQLAEVLIDALARMPTERPAAWRRVRSRHNEALLGAALADDRLFERLGDQLRVPTSEGDLAVPAVVARSRGRIHVSLGEGGGYEEVLFRAMQVPVVSGVRYGALPFCERYAEVHGGEVVRLGTAAGTAALFPAVEVDEATRARLDALFGRADRQVVPTRFAPAELPVVLVADREVALKRRIEQDETDKRISSALLGLARLYTEQIADRAQHRLFVNLDSPVVRRLVARDGAVEAAVARVVEAFADLTTDRRDAEIEVDGGAALRLLDGALTALLGASAAG